MLQEVWRSTICQALKQSSGEEFGCRFLDSNPTSTKQELPRVWTLFSASAQLTGEIGLFLSEADASVLCRLIRGGSPEESAEHSGCPEESLAAFLQGVADTASAALMAKTKGQAEFRFQGAEPPSWEAAAEFRFEVYGAKKRPVNIGIVMDEAFAQSATQLLAACALPPPKSERTSVIQVQNPVSLEEDNMGLFLDIELEATLRFGEREMLLREILNLNSGSVIELNRRVNEPVELLVRGKVVAKGDVVVLDGNYALRVTQIANPADRMSSLAIR
jgi:flagellar motor switch protein FliN/FliY